MTVGRVSNFTFGSGAKPKGKGPVGYAKGGGVKDDSDSYERRAANRMNEDSVRTIPSPYTSENDVRRPYDKGADLTQRHLVEEKLKRITESENDYNKRLRDMTVDEAAASVYYPKGTYKSGGKVKKGKR